MAIEAIEELKNWKQWVAWSRSKIPIAPNGTPASSTNPQTWGTLEEAKFIRRVQQLPGVGFVFSGADPFVGIDLDDAVNPVTDELKPWALEIVERIDSYTEYSPSSMGVHIWVRGTIPRNGAKRLEEGFKVEVYKQARYFTVTGRHLQGTPQRIEERDLSEWFEEVFGYEEEEAGERWADAFADGAWEAPDVEEWIGEALTYLDADDYHDWVKVGMAIKAELGDRGFGFWDVWSRSSQKYPGARKAEQKWRSFGYDGEVTIASVVWMAEQNGFTVPKGRGGDNAEDWSDWLALQEQVAPVANNAGGGGVAGSGLDLVVHDAADLYGDTSPFEPDLISPGMMGTGDMVLLFGPPKSMKSMVIMDMFRNFALARDWCGFSPQRALRTFYCQFEVKADKMRQRLQLAGMQPDEVEALRGKLMITERFTPVLSADFVVQFAELAIRTFGKGGLDVLILDPLANIYSGDNENDNAQMAQFLRQIKIMRNAIDPDVAIVMVHHSSKMGRQDRHQDPFNAGRGASALRGAYDTGIYLDRIDEESDLLKMWLELRNGPRVEPMMLEFENGVFVEPDATEQGEMDLGHLSEMDVERVEIERILRDQGVQGNYFTDATFAESFAGSELGSASSIKRHLSRLATRQSIAWFRSVGSEWLPEPHHRSKGYLCCRNMVLQFRGRVHEVEPDRIKDPGSGRVVDVIGWPNG